MNNEIHPKYYPDAKAKCVCGNKWATGSTMPEISTGICSNCHPFYSGKKTIVDTQGRVDKFKRRVAAASPKKK